MNSHAPSVGRWRAFWIDAEFAAVRTLTELGRTHGLRRRTLPPHLVTGERGELAALFFLRKLGYQVVERRWRAPGLRGDLDLIAWEAGTLCLVEVKTRTERDQTPAAAAVDRTKRRLLAEMSHAYIRTLPRTTRAGLLRRYDLVSVYLMNGTTECELIRGLDLE